MSACHERHTDPLPRISPDHVKVRGGALAGASSVRKASELGPSALGTSPIEGIRARIAPTGGVRAFSYTRRSMS